MIYVPVLMRLAGLSLVKLGENRRRGQVSVHRDDDSELSGRLLACVGKQHCEWLSAVGGTVIITTKESKEIKLHAPESSVIVTVSRSVTGGEKILTMVDIGELYFTQTAIICKWCGSTGIPKYGTRKGIQQILFLQVQVQVHCQTWGVL